MTNYWEDSYMGKVATQQIAIGSDNGNPLIYALDTEGRLWVSRNGYRGAWTQIDVPETNIDAVNIPPHKPIRRQP